jgi:hypothetical protein
MVWVNAGHGRTGTILQVCSPRFSATYTAESFKAYRLLYVSPGLTCKNSTW